MNKTKHHSFLPPLPTPYSSSVVGVLMFDEILKQIREKIASHQYSGVKTLK